MRWEEFAAAAPELAELGRERLNRTNLCLVGTLRRDGSPRISPVEPDIVDGDLMLGMMWRSRKALDLLRDPRVVVHSTVCDREGTEGDFKLYGRAIEVRDPEVRRRYADAVERRLGWRPPDRSHVFSVDVASAGFVVFQPDAYALRWTPAGGVHRLTAPTE